MRSGRARVSRSALVSGALAVLLLAAGRSDAQTPFEGEGRVVAVDQARGAVTLDHGRIADLVPTGRTTFPVRHVDLLRNVQAGDLVRFSLVVADDSHGILTVSSLEPRSSIPAGSPARVSVRDTAWWAFVAPSVALLALGLVWYALWRALRKVRKTLAAAVAAEEDLRRDLHAVLDTLQGIAGTLRGSYLPELRQRIEAVQAVRRANGAGDAVRGRPVPPMFLVRHGETDLYRMLQERLGTSGIARVTWDRRRGERRRSDRSRAPERRREDRRRPPPQTWAALGFVVTR